MEVIIVIVVVFVVFFIGGVIHATSKNKSSNSINEKEVRAAYREYSKLEKLKFEFPRRKQILDESMSLIEKTNNINTLLSRYIDVNEQHDWIKQKIKEGMPINFHHEGSDFMYELNRIANINISRIVNNQYIEYQKKINSLKTKKAIENNTIKMFEFLENATNSLKNHSNKEKVENEIKEVHFLVENNFSDKQ